VSEMDGYICGACSHTFREHPVRGRCNGRPFCKCKRFIYTPVIDPKTLVRPENDGGSKEGARKVDAAGRAWVFLCYLYEEGPSLAAFEFSAKTGGQGGEGGESPWHGATDAMKLGWAEVLKDDKGVVVKRTNPKSGVGCKVWTITPAGIEEYERRRRRGMA
jgi:hypothetical protein